jgi:membrane protein YdbS with pleckstrin-like domain
MPQYQPLDPRALRLWQLTDLIAYLVLIALLVGGGLVVMWLRRSLAAPVIGVWLFFILLAAWTILYYHPRNYRAWGYQLDRRVLLIRKGVWFRSIKLLPLPRLQHVDVKRGPLQRHFGLATLVMHTAGTHAAAIEIPGLDADEALRLRDRLVAAGGDDGV